MLPTLRTHPRLHRRNPQINFLIVTNHRYVLKDSDLFFSQHLTAKRTPYFKLPKLSSFLLLDSYFLSARLAPRHQQNPVS